ncbi:hypothetical protein EX30DRAFT_341498 [Ascodesmis nigricans]|uniref:Uncharacterized protein n=1 Tax=Ascodesmis nigricans TaxID=341454 RepID=A0A4S2MVD8_9PEZI|nr:hypothetical protein EX30DRAFT_341498 [Ascodesmis nigricans]
MRNQGENATSQTTSPLSHPPPYASTSTSTNPKPTANPDSPASLVLTHPEADPFRRIRSNAALCVAIGFPILAALPPRKFDIYTFMLGVSWVVAVNEIAEERAGMGLLRMIGGGLRERRLTEEGETELVRLEREKGWKGEAVRRAQVDEEEGLGIAEMIGKRIREAVGLEHVDTDGKVGSVAEEVEKIKGTAKER